MQSDFRGSLLKIIESRGCKQEDLAKEIGVSQATVCRALERDYSRHSKGRTKIEDYLKRNELKLNSDATVPNEIGLAVTKVWDRTQTHARILAGVIESLGELIPKTHREVENHQHDQT